jgi:hypothetical protein
MIYTKLVMSILLCSSIVMAQTTEPEIAKPEKPQTCSQQLEAKTEKLGNTAAGVGGAGVFVGGFIALAAPTGGLSVVAGGVTVAAILIISSEHKYKAIKLFEGAATGGNGATARAWRKANRKDPEFFKKITYVQFLDSIHKANVSGEACRMKAVPSKKDLVKMVKIDLDTEDESESSKSTGAIDSLDRSNPKDGLDDKSGHNKKEASSASDQ